MAEKTVVTDPKEKEEKTIGEEIREKSFQQLLKEDQVEKAKTPEDKAPEHTPELDEKAKEDARLAKEAEEAKAKVEADEADKKRTEEIAAKAAQDVIKKQDEEKQKELDKAREAEEAKQREESLKPKFTGKDAEGNVVPKDYEEIARESARIARMETLTEVAARDKQREDARVKAEQERTQTEEAQKAQKKAYEDQLQKELDTDLNDLYLNNKLPKIKDPKDENDPGNKEFKNLFETAQRVNGERIAKGEAPIRSIKLIYYEHYKPLGKPAGHDAPVLGSESPLSHDAPEDKYIPARDRNKTMAQLLKEETMRMARKMGVRGS